MNGSSDSEKAPAAKTESLGEQFRHDFVASIVVFLVALPLCIGIAVAVGVNPGRALVTGIIGGIVVGFFSGAPMQVSGPAAGLFVIVADLLIQRKAEFFAMSESADEAAAFEYALAGLAASVFLAGVFQFIAGRLNLGQWFRAVSPAVILGMLSGIGVLIIVSQFHVMLDHTAFWHGEPARGGMQLTATIPEAILKCFSPQEGHRHHLAAATGILTISVIILWQILVPRRLRLIPAALIAILAATLFAWIEKLEIIKLEVPESIMADISVPTLQWFASFTDVSIIISGFVIAIVASAETLLCAGAVDKMHSGKRTNYDKELCAQGIGNALCGLLGALPMTGVIVRSSANVTAGARTRMATILHGGWLLVFVVFFPGVLEHIPRAALGALLVYTGFKLVNFKAIYDLWSIGKSEVLICLTTLVLIVATDLLTGVIVGIVLSAMKLLHRFSHFEVQLNISSDGSRAVMSLRGAGTFLRLPVLTRELERVPPAAELHVDLHELDYLDHACLEQLISWAEQHQKDGGGLVLDWDLLHAHFQREPSFSETQRLEAGYTMGKFHVKGDFFLTPRPLSELSLPNYGVLVLGIRHTDGTYDGVPNGKSCIVDGDILLAYGRQERLADIQKCFNQYETESPVVKQIEKP